MTDGSTVDATDSVLIVCLSRVFGGADVRVLQTARWLQRNNLPYVVAVLRNSKLHNMLQQENLSVKSLNRARGDPRLVIDLARLARESGATVLDAHNMQSQYWGALASWSLKIPNRVATVHSVYRQTHPHFLRKLLHEGSLRVSNLLGFQFIAVSPVVRAYLADDLHFDADKITLSLNGLEPLDTKAEACDIRTEARWPKDTFVVGTVGRLETVKGHRYLFKALKKSIDDGVNTMRLYIVGTGKDQELLLRMADELDISSYIHFAGFRSDINEIFAAIDVLCQPSDSEGLPYSVLEACRQGVPVLASNLPGIASVLTDAKTAFLFPTGHVDILAQKLGLLLKSPERRKKVGNAGKRLIISKLSVDQMMDITVNVYRNNAMP